MNLPPTTQLKNIDQLGLGGLNTINEPSDINDIELANIRNMIFDSGILQPRKGSLLNLAKPTGETSKPFQLLIATTSDGIDYGIANYGTNFYLRDTINNQWIKLNQAYTPATGGVFYGSVNWNAGIVDDRFYFGDGVTDVMKWIMAVNTLKVTTAASDTTITLDDSTSFPATGSIIIQNGGTQVILQYSANDTDTGILTLTGTVGSIINSGVTITTPIQDVANDDSGIPHASVFCLFQGRLFTANSVGAESTIHYSVVGDPEDHSVTSDVDSGGFYTLYKGKGGILGMTDYGTYLTIQKQDVISQFSFSVASDNSGFIVQVFPLISGDDIGPVTDSEILQYMNTVYYPTLGAGIVSFNPAQTGTSTGSSINLLSQNINNIVTNDLDFSLSRTAALGQKLYWLCAISTIGTPLGVNNLVLMYDLVRAQENSTKSAWTLYDNWNAVDIKPINGVLFYLSADDGALYEAYQGYQDAVAGQPHPYNAYALTKRFNLDSPSTLYRPQFIYIEGIISINTTIYARVLDNENGSLASQAFKILGNNTKITSSFTAGLGRFQLATPLLGGVDLNVLPANQSTLQFFRVYLEVSQAFRVHNLQMEIFSTAEGSQWGVSRLTIISQPEPSIENALVLSPTSAPVITPAL